MPKTVEAQVRYLRGENLTYSQIAETLHISQRTVRYWLSPSERERKSRERARAWKRKTSGGIDQAAVEEQRARQQAEVRERRIEAQRLRHLAREERRKQTWSNTNASDRLRELRRRRKGCDLTVEDMAALLAVQTCQRTGIPFEHRGMFGRSIDRIDSAKGYVKGNVQVVCWVYNVAKNEGTDDDVLRMARALVAQADRWD